MGYNGFGYRQNTHEWICFDSYKTVRGYVKDLFDQRLATMSLAESICLYNTGHKINNCTYYENYKKL